MATPEGGPKLGIRPAQSDDATALREIFNDAVSDGMATFDYEPRSIEEQRYRIANAEQDPKHPLIVAEVRNWVAGWAAIEEYDFRLTLDDIGEVFIFVRRSFRSYGIGRQLMRAVQADAPRLGYRKLIGRVLADNRDSLRLCLATGWREVGRHRAHARHRDSLRDVVLVEYLVPDPGSPQENAPTRES
ncbi:MAG: N-acetyltransferase family protein [Candidatus Acidiferrales bacterium]